jgi:hypothetical protein
MFAWGIKSIVKFNSNAGSYGHEQYVFIIIFSLWYIQTIQFGRHQQLPKIAHPQ